MKFFGKFYSLHEMSFDHSKRTVYFIDIDETLFKTFARVGVMKDGQVVKYLSNQEYNGYKLQPGETWQPWGDSEFRSAKVFKDTSQPIIRGLNRLQHILENIPPHSKVYLLTARGVVDKPSMFLSVFKAYGIDTKKFEILWAEDIGHYPAKNKKILINQYLKAGLYDKVVMIDDSRKNLVYFYSLHLQYPKIEFEVYLSMEGGRLKKLDLDHTIEKEAVPSAYRD